MLASSSATLVDFAAERTRRREVSRQAAAATERLVANLQDVAKSLANLAWTLAAPVRHRDDALKEGIYELVLARLRTVATDTLDDSNHAPEMKDKILEQALNVAFAAFQTQLMILMAAEHDGRPAS